MVYMIAKRRPAIEESFLNPPEGWYVEHYQKMVENMKVSHRFPAMAFVFDNSPAFNTFDEKSKIRFNLKGDTYSLFGPWYHFEKSIDPLAEYIRKNMTLVESLSYLGHTARCFVDKKRLGLKLGDFQALNRQMMNYVRKKIGNVQKLWHGRISA